MALGDPTLTGTANSPLLSGISVGGGLETVILASSKLDKTGMPKIGLYDIPYRYTNTVTYHGDSGIEVSVTGAFIPSDTLADANGLPLNFVGVTSSGKNPIAQLEAWERTGTRLTYSDDQFPTGKTVVIVSPVYHLKAGIPLAQIIYYSVRFRETL